MIRKIALCTGLLFGCQVPEDDTESWFEGWVPDTGETGGFEEDP